MTESGTPVTVSKNPMIARTENNHTSFFVNGDFVSQHIGNTMEGERLAKETIMNVYGPVVLESRTVGGHGRVAISYRTIGAF